MKKVMYIEDYLLNDVNFILEILSSSVDFLRIYKQVVVKKQDISSIQVYINNNV